MTLLVRHPVTYREERLYIYHVVFKEFLGFDYRLIAEERRDTLITAEGEEARQLIVSEVLFQIPAEKWLSNESLPAQPLERWKVSNDLPEVSTISREIEVIYGIRLEGGHFYLQDDNEITLGLDIFGSIFFMLTRYEEIVKKDRDQHDRFPAIASLAYQEGFLERPIVNEYLEILWACLKKLWPMLRRKERVYQLCLSHDVDNPLGAANKPWFQVLRNTAGDMVKRKDLRLAYHRFLAKFSGNYDKDPNNTFDFIMSVSEQYGLKSAFYFKAGSSNNQFDENYKLDMSWIQALLRRINERGYEVGLHPSYETYRDENKLNSEFQALLQATKRLNIDQEIWGARQHYLRWENPITWQIYEDVGLAYDTTLTFADHAGFRCGTCYEFQVFNLKTRKVLHLREHPLIVMDGTLLDEQYMALRLEQVLETIKHLSNSCRCYHGTFSLLWHNSNLIQSWQKELYLEILRTIIHDRTK